jgi:hypothetical protein
MALTPLASVPNSTAPPLENVTGLKEDAEPENPAAWPAALMTVASVMVALGKAPKSTIDQSAAPQTAQDVAQSARPYRYLTIAFFILRLSLCFVFVPNKTPLCHSASDDRTS